MRPSSPRPAFVLSLLLLALLLPLPANAQPQPASAPPTPSYAFPQLPDVDSTADAPAVAPPVAAPELGSGAADGAWVMFGPSGRSGHSAIYDPVRDRMIVFGGVSYGSGFRERNDLWALSLTGTPTWTQLSPAGTPPAARWGQSAIYDPVRDRMIVFGGYGFTDIWALSLAGTPAWTQLTPTGAPPSAHMGQTAVYDPLRDRMLVFGGSGGSQATYNDVWALSLAGTPAWTKLTPTGTLPAALSGASSIYDPVRDRMLIFGGSYLWTLRNKYVYPGNVWALSLAGTPDWSLLSVAETPAGQPSGRSGCSAIYDSPHDRMVVFGGESLSGTTWYAPREVWTLSLAGPPTWTSMSPSGAWPAGRTGHSAIYDPPRGRMVVFGGAISGGYGGFADLWILPLAGTPAWTGAPSARSGASAIYDPGRDRMVLFGGSPGSGYGMNDIWALPLTGALFWTPLAPAGAWPIPRYEHNAFYDPRRDRMLVYGGLYFVPGWGMYYLNDVWAMSLSGTPTWTRLTTSGTPPPGGGSAAIYDPVRDRILAYYNGGAPDKGVWALSLAGTPTWTQLTTSGTRPQNESSHSAIYDPVRDRMLVYGGDGLTLGEPSYSHVWALSLGDSPTWTELAFTGAAPGWRSCLNAMYDPVRDRMVIYGGMFHSYGAFSEAWALSLGDAPAWTQLPRAPLGRRDHSAIYDPVRDRMMLFGGDEAVGPAYSDLFALVWGTPMRDVTIDIRPGDGENAVNLGSHGVLPVAILSDDSFDATTVDPWSVKLAGAGARVRPNGTLMAFREDVNGDGRADLVVHVETDSLKLAPADTVAKLTGSAPDHLTVRGADRVRVVSSSSRPPKLDPTPLAAGGVAAPALLGVRSMPGRGVKVSLALLPGAPASLELLDVAGRRVERLRLEGGGSGPQEASLGGPALTPGVYWVRLGQAGRTFTRKVVLLR